MTKTLVLAEKPSVGRELARVLGCRNNNNGYIEGAKHIVTWALGHLVTLADPEHYGEQYKQWRIDTLPMLPEKMALRVIPETSKQYQTVKTLLKRNDVSAIIIATDAGREGELVARWILAKAACNKPIKRLWISSQTDKAIKEGFANLKDGKAYDNLYQSAQARAEADWLVGLNVTRALTCKFNAQLSAGRVQTPTLALIVRREQEIRQFVPKDYHTVNVDLGGFFASYRDAKNQTTIFAEKEAREVATRCKNATLMVTEVITSEKRIPPPPLFDLTELQREANKRYGFSAKETLSIMQRLYEQHKILTYPRTDSRYLTDDIVPTLRERLLSCAVGDYGRLANTILKEKRMIAKACVNNAKVSDHHAIIPTEQTVRLSDLNATERQIYFLVVERFLACFHGDHTYQQIKIRLKSGADNFSATGKLVVNKGWKAVSDLEEEVEEVEQNLPQITKGQQFAVKNVQLKPGKTSPPSRYTEASLLAAMENPSKFIEDRKLKEFIGGGLGTPATRADIIEKLFSTFYVEKREKSLIPTSKGMQLIDLVPQELREPLLTAKWEQQLEQISQGKVQRKQFITAIREYSATLVNQVKESQAGYKHDNLTHTPCPKCSKMLLRVQGKRGVMLVCQDRDCGHRQNVSLQSKVRCPNCRKMMEIYGEDEARTYVCPCGFREKVEAFHKKRSNTSGASKGEVQRYLKQQQQQEKKQAEPELNAFAAALAKAKEKK